MICGTPTPATMRVVQIEPGPMPTLTRVGAVVGQRLRAVRRRDVAADDLRPADSCFLTQRTRSSTPCEWPCAVSTTSTSTPGLDQRLDALLGVLAGADRRADAQPAELVLARDADARST